MRALYLIVLFAGCQSAFGTKDMLGSGSGSGGAGSPECADDSDCALAAATCCECPTFALSTRDPAAQACSQVQCPMQMCPSNARAACNQGACTLECVAMACQNTCTDGFQIDANGCLTCDCAQVSAPQCAADSDCVRTRADCCGCAHGGSDTAVPASQQAAFDASLGCAIDPQCPSDSCSVTEIPRCIEGACELAKAAPANACGTPDLPACPPGQQCLVNVNSDADQQGVGVCM
jgi:hypothetical protein